MNAKDVFTMEYGISQGFMEHTEFYEGVRALLVDKDKNRSGSTRVSQRFRQRT